MEKLFDKLSSYNIVNYIIPGAVFFYFISYIWVLDINANIISLLCIYYFSGMVLSRIGSVFIEPFFLKYDIIRYAPYELYLIASKENSKIEILNEHNNMFRTFSSVFFVLMFLSILEFFTKNENLSIYFIFLTYFIFILMIKSWIKQTDYIVKSINYAIIKRQNII